MYSSQEVEHILSQLLGTVNRYHIVTSGVAI